mmetsp:Transcript_117750/g.327967  ORF Transcript_117750/g.327967 Transcript_117750/m.327967 type:complete len:143 (+) Transcript_117750:1660-2088(+)
MGIITTSHAMCKPPRPSHSRLDQLPGNTTILLKTRCSAPSLPVLLSSASKRQEDTSVWMCKSAMDTLIFSLTDGRRAELPAAGLSAHKGQRLPHSEPLPFAEPSRSEARLGERLLQGRGGGDDEVLLLLLLRARESAGAPAT